MIWPTRRMTDNDKNFILSSWIKHARSIYPFKWLSRDGTALYKARVECLVSTLGATVAVDPVDPTVIYGWICFAPGVLHMTWCRWPFRRNYVCTQLVRDTFQGQPVLYTHYAPSIEEFKLEKKWNLAEYQPSLIEAQLFPAVDYFEREVLENERRRRSKG